MHPVKLLSSPACFQAGKSRCLNLAITQSKIHIHSTSKFNFLIRGSVQVHEAGGNLDDGMIQEEGSLRVNAPKRNFSAGFQRARALVTMTTVHTLRREIFTSCPLLNVGVA